MNLQKWVENNFAGLRLLTLSNEDYRPGAIVGRESHSIYEYAWKVLNEAGTEVHWTVAEGAASLMHTTFNRETAVKSSFALLGLLSFNADLSRSVEATLSVEDARFRRFTQMTPRELDERLRVLQKSKSSRWPKIDEKRVITSCYYITKMTVTFKEGGALLTKAQVEKIVKPSASAGANLTWRTEQTLEVSGNGQIPFGFQGIVL